MPQSLRDARKLETTYLASEVGVVEMLPVAVLEEDYDMLEQKNKDLLHPPEWQAVRTTAPTLRPSVDGSPIHGAAESFFRPLV